MSKLTHDEIKTLLEGGDGQSDVVQQHLASCESCRSYADLLGQLAENRWNPNAVKGIGSAEKSQLINQTARHVKLGKSPIVSTTNWATLAGGLALAIVVGLLILLLTGRLDRTLRPAEMPIFPTPAPNSYDGWDTGFELSYPESLPLRLINNSPGEINLIFVSPDIELQEGFEASANGQGYFASIYVFEPSPLPSGELMTAKLMVEMINSDDGLKEMPPPGFNNPTLSYPAKVVTLGGVEYGTATMTDTLYGQTTLAYQLFGVLDDNQFLVTAYAHPEEEAALQAAVHEILETIEPIVYSDWDMLAPNAPYSVAYPAAWRPELLDRDAAAYALLPPEVAINDVMPGDMQARSYVELHVDEVSDDDMALVVAEAISAFDLVGSDAAVVVAPENLPFVRGAAMSIVEPEDGVTVLLGVRQLDDGQVVQMQWGVDSAEIETARPIFERILRSIRPRTVDPLFAPPSATETSSLAPFTNRNWKLIAGHTQNEGAFGPSESDYLWPSLVFHIKDFDPSQQVSLLVECGTFGGVFDVPDPFSLAVDKWSQQSTEVIGEPCSPEARIRSDLALALFDEPLTYLHQDYLILSNGDAALFFRKDEPNSLYPYASDQIEALDPFLLRLYLERGDVGLSEVSRNRLPSAAPLNTPSYTIKQMGSELTVYVYEDGTKAQDAVLRLQDSSETTTQFWHDNRYLIAWQGDNNAALEALLEKLFGPAVTNGTE